MEQNNIPVTVVVEGDMGHGSRPAEIKRHAIYAAFDFLTGLRSTLPKNAVEVQSISTGGTNSPNQFPGSCRVVITVSASVIDAEKIVDNYIAHQPRVSRI